LELSESIVALPYPSFVFSMSFKKRKTESNKEKALLVTFAVKEKMKREKG